MKYLKMLGLAAVAAAALMALVGAGTASAKEGVLCSTTSNPCNSKWAINTTLEFSLKKETSAKLVNAADTTQVLDTCTGTGTKVHGDLTANPAATGTATGKITSLIWEKCTFTTTTVTPGALTVERIAGTSNGTVREDPETESKVTINTVFFGSCVYGVKGGAHLGVITEGKANESHFTANEAVAEKLEGSNVACPPKALWTATYVLTVPTNTTLSVSSS
jgi:hypothetical protein